MPEPTTPTPPPNTDALHHMMQEAPSWTGGYIRYDEPRDGGSGSWVIDVRLDHEQARQMALHILGLDAVPSDDAALLDFILRRITHMNTSYRMKPNIMKSTRLSWHVDRPSDGEFLAFVKTHFREAFDHANRS